MVDLIITFEGNVEEALMALDTAINPVALADFLDIKVDPYVRARVKARFAGQGDDVVGQWAAHRPATAVYRQEQGFAPGPINRRTGEMERFLTEHESLVTAMGDGAMLTAPGRAASGELATKLRRAQQGDKEVNTVPRPVIGMNAQDLVAVMALLGDHVETTVTQRGGF